MPAGPSEVLVIADGSASASFVAADLLSQAEHGSDSQVILLTTSQELAERVIQELKRQLATLGRREIVEASMAHSRIIVVDDVESAITISNRYAPEHLIMQVDSPRNWLSAVRNAGSVFLGPWAPESVGDYCSGTNHVLPTNGYANAYSGLGIDQFLRQMSVQELSHDGLLSIAETVVELASIEGLDAHAAAVKLRLESPQ
jgi:histidinol dehydrogenase